MCLNEKVTRVINWIILFACVLAASHSLAQDIGDPTPLITANNVSNSVTILGTDALSIHIQLDTDTAIGILADWWIVADTPFGFYHYLTVENSWLPGIALSAQNVLFDIAPIRLLSVPMVPLGTYIFYFGVDIAPNGKIDTSLLEYSSVVVNVEN